MNVHLMTLLFGCRTHHSHQYLIGVGKSDHQIHALALSQMLKQRWTNGHWGTMEELLTRNIVIEEVIINFRRLYFRMRR